MAQHCELGQCSGLGAFLMLPYLLMAAESPSKPVTFAKDVALSSGNCQELSPSRNRGANVSLVTYEETRPMGGQNQGSRGQPQYAAMAPRQNCWNPAFQERHFVDR